MYQPARPVTKAHEGGSPCPCPRWSCSVCDSLIPAEQEAREVAELAIADQASFMDEDDTQEKDGDPSQQNFARRDQTPQNIQHLLRRIPNSDD